MFYISLPYFYENQKFNNFFKNYINKYPEKLIVPFDIDYVHGALPWSYWNGGINLNSGKLLLIEDIKKIIDNSIIPISVNQSNILLNSTDYFDRYEKIITSMVNECELSDFNLLSFISKNINPNILFSISHKAEYINSLDIETINDILSKDFISYFITATDNNYKNKNKIRIIINNCSSCNNNKQCTINENINIYNFSKISVYNNCTNCLNNKNYYKLIIPFLEKGYKYFKIEETQFDLKVLNQSLVQSFIKSEYIGECLYEYINS